MCRSEIKIIVATNETEAKAQLAAAIDKGKYSKTAIRHEDSHHEIKLRIFDDDDAPPVIDAPHKSCNAEHTDGETKLYTIVVECFFD